MENNRPDAKPADSVIRFACNFCGRKIRVPATFAGKKGKCPNCKKVVLIPESSTPQPPEKPGEPIRLNRNLDPRHISKASVPDAQSDAMDDIERHLQPLPDQQQITPEQKQLLNLWSERFPGQDEPEPESDLPWFIDLLAYPFNVSGIIHLFLFWAIPVLLSLTQPFFMFTPYGALLWLILAVFFWGYVFYYLFRCLIASAKGKHRAPDVSLEDPPRPSDLVRQLLLILACIALCFAPMALYWSYTNRWQSDVTYLLKLTD